MGHGCHDCGSPNSCECPGTYGDWYNQYYGLGTTDLPYLDWDSERKRINTMSLKPIAAHCISTAENAPCPKALSEIELIGVLIENLPRLSKAEGKRVLDYAQRLYDDKHGSVKVMR